MAVRARAASDEAPALEREQHGRKKERDEAEQMARRLSDPIRHQAEDGPADERRRRGGAE